MTEVLRTHVARGPEPFEVAPRRQRDTPHHKPRGFWWEVDGDWRRWCAAENWGHASGHLFAVDLGSSRILRIRSVAEMDDFHDQWSQPLVADQPGMRYIRWDLVAGRWDGIEIAPYLWERRLDGDASRWYYTWDCASGCVWNPVGVRVEHLGPWRAGTDHHASPPP